MGIKADAEELGVELKDDDGREKTLAKLRLEMAAIVKAKENPNAATRPEAKEEAKDEAKVVQPSQHELKRKKEADLILKIPEMGEKALSEALLDKSLSLGTQNILTRKVQEFATKRQTAQSAKEERANIKPKPVSSAVPVAKTTAVEAGLESAMAIKNASKYIGGTWIHLHKGKIFHANKLVIASLRTGGFAK